MLVNQFSTSGACGFVYGQCSLGLERGNMNLIHCCKFLNFSKITAKLIPKLLLNNSIDISDLGYITFMGDFNCFMPYQSVWTRDQEDRNYLLTRRINKHEYNYSLVRTAYYTEGKPWGNHNLTNVLLIHCILLLYSNILGRNCTGWKKIERYNSFTEAKSRRS